MQQEKTTDKTSLQPSSSSSPVLQPPSVTTTTINVDDTFFPPPPTRPSTSDVTSVLPSSDDNNALVHPLACVITYCPNSLVNEITCDSFPSIEEAKKYVSKFSLSLSSCGIISSFLPADHHNAPYCEVHRMAMLMPSSATYIDTAYIRMTITIGDYHQQIDEDGIIDLELGRQCALINGNTADIVAAIRARNVFRCDCCFCRTDNHYHPSKVVTTGLRSLGELSDSDILHFAGSNICTYFLTNACAQEIVIDIIFPAMTYKDDPSHPCASVLTFLTGGTSPSSSHTVRTILSALAIKILKRKV